MIDNKFEFTKYNKPTSKMDGFIYNLNTIYCGYESSNYRIVKFNNSKDKINWLHDYMLLDIPTDFNDKEKLKHIINECNNLDQIPYRGHVSEYRRNFNNSFIFTNAINYYANLFNDNKYVRKHKGDIEFVNFDIFKFTKIQVILVNTDKSGLINFINKEFDFDICKNAISYDDHKFNCYINSFNDILNRYTKFKFTIDQTLSEARRIKYEKRDILFS